MDVKKIQISLKTSIYKAKIPERLKLPQKDILPKNISAKYVQLKNISTDKPDLFGSIDEYLNLSHRKLDNFIKIINSPKSKNTEKILKSINRLIKRGIVGYEYLDIRKQPYKSFITTKLVSPYSRAKIYRKPIINKNF